MDYVWFGLGLLALTGLTVVLGRWGGVGVGFFPAWAMTRAVVQLSIVALVQLSIVALLLCGILAAP